MAKMYSGTAEKVEAIRKILIENKDGVWIQELARKTGLSPGLVYYFIKTYMKDEVIKRRISIGDRYQKASYIVIVKLKK